MLRESKYDHPADAYLVEALRQSAIITRDGYYDIARIMERERQTHGELLEGTPVMVDGEEVPYLAPEMAERTGNFVDEVTEKMLEHLANAGTLQAQRDLLLLGIRDMLVCSTFDEVHPKHATAMISSIEELFRSYGDTNIPMSRELLNVRNDIYYYARIGYDGLDVVNALMREMQDKQGIDPAKQMATPGSLAWIRRMQAHPVRDDAESFDDTDDLHLESGPIFTDMLEPYTDVLPTDVGVDMLGLLLRAAEQVGDNEIRKPRMGARCAANDDAPQNVQALLMHPLVKMRTRAVINTLFQKYPEAALTPQGVMDASIGLEELLVAETQRAEQRGGR